MNTMNTLKYLVHRSRPYRGKEPPPDLHYWGVRPDGITRAGVLPCKFQGVCLERVEGEGLGWELQFWVADPVLGEKPGVVWVDGDPGLRALVLGIVAEGGQLEPVLDWLQENPAPVHPTTQDVDGKRRLIQERINAILGVQG